MWGEKMISDLQATVDVHSWTDGNMRKEPWSLNLLEKIVEIAS
jgi:hypothetical protein